MSTESRTPPHGKPRPFVKWAGGKRQLLKILCRYLPKDHKYMNYFEIFGGGGALFFSLDAQRIQGVLHFSDSNEELINAYRVVRDDVENLIRHLRRHSNDPAYFTEIRNWDRSPGYRRRNALTRASRFIYLNKTAYNGLYRVNSRGEFNTPHGRYKRPRIVDAENLRACSAFLQDVRIEACSYERVLPQISRADFVYLDPPYAPLSATASFTSYTGSGFDELEQVKLFQFCKELHRKGAYFMLSNSSAPWVVELYRKEKPFRVDRVQAKRAVNCKASGRGAVAEIIVRNY